MAMNSTAATFIGDRTDFRDETIYFAMTTRFYDGDPKNNVYCWDGVNNINDPEWRGDFRGLINKLDYIKALGFTAVWITPIVENGSGLDYHGYHAMDFSKIDHRYVAKDLDDKGADVAFQELIDEVHKRGMKPVSYTHLFPSGDGFAGRLRPYHRHRRGAPPTHGYGDFAGRLGLSRSADTLRAGPAAAQPHAA